MADSVESLGAIIKEYAVKYDRLTKMMDSKQSILKSNKTSSTMKKASVSSQNSKLKLKTEVATKP